MEPGSKAMFLEWMLGASVKIYPVLHTNHFHRIWLYSLVQATRGAAMMGPSPALRNAFIRLGRLASIPVSVVMVFDGPSRPSTKRGTQVLQREYSFIKHLKAFTKAFGFHVHEVSSHTAQGLFI